MASRQRSILRDTRLGPSLDHRCMAVDFSLSSESLLTPPPSSPEPSEFPYLTSPKLSNSDDITQNEHAECEWCLCPDICIRTAESEKVNEAKVFFWSILPGGRAISLAAINRVLNRKDSSRNSSSNSEMRNKARLKKMEKLEGEEFKRQLRIARTRQEDKKSEERRKWMWEMHEKWADEEGDEMPLVKRMKKGREREETKRMWKMGGAKR